MKRCFAAVFVISFMILLSVPVLAIGGGPPEKILTVESSAPAPVLASTSEVEATPEPVVSAEVIAPAIPAKELTKGGLYRVRTGIFSKKEAAIGLANSLKAEGFSTAVVSQAGLWRVQVGAFRSEKSAVTLAGKLKIKGHQADILVTE